ncbi:hypothetical protein [uncultured Lacinutrix sp.]|uniref:hypothetical protein n=1 Tax=uncultured Lacinutrix sp. TaxID=574032 RepID=UPI002602A5AC|nr:hypothetical protein [uncultured Lacinutrix sp.]
MKFLKPITILLLLAFITINFQCTAAKRAHKLPVEVETSLKFTKPYFQIWNAAIKYGSSGANLYLPNLESNTNAEIKKVYFRGMSANLEKGRAIHTALLTKPKLNDGSLNPNVPQEDFPFDLRPNECVVSYIESGYTKYFLIEKLIEKEGVYYPDGPPKKIN